MNKFALLFLALLAYAYADEESSSSSSEEDLKALATLVKTKLNSTIINDFIILSEKTKKQCPDIEEKLDLTMDEVGDCIDDIDLGEGTFCSLMRNNLDNCSEPVRKLLVGCLPEESKGLPILAIKIVKAFIDEACNSTVEQVLELLNPCVVKKEFKTYDSCKRIRKALAEHKDKIPSKSLVCSMLPNLTSCVKSHREASCKNPVTKTAAVNFYEAIESATDSECQDLNRTK